MTPLPRGPSRSFAALALLGLLVVGMAPASAEDPPMCLGEPVTLLVQPGVPLTGTPDGDVILGTDGPDEVHAGDGPDLICGGGGDDSIDAGGGDDAVDGGPGNDTVLGGSGSDVLDGGLGADTLSGEGDADELWAGPGADVVHGGDGDDRLYGGGGRDSLRGDAGDDRLFGEARRDRLFGGDGIDELQGGPDDDRLFGEAGGDFLWGDEGADYLAGGAGDDLLQGGPGADALKGGPDFDEMWGGECSLKSNPDGAVRCRLVPSGRPEGSPAVDPGDAFDGGRGRDACNKSPVLPPGCDTYRGERPPYSPVKIETSQEWWGLIEKAFSERAHLLLGDEEQEIADALLAEVEHAKQVAACESLGDVFQQTRAQGTVAYGQTTWDGLFQHDPKHWWWRARDAGWPGASIFDPLANARIAAWMVAEDIGRYWDRADRVESRLAWARWSCDDFLDRLGYWDPT